MLLARRLSALLGLIAALLVLLCCNQGIGVTAARLTKLDEEAYFDAAKEIRLLRSAEWEKTITLGTGLQLVFLGLKTCSHCKLLAPKWLQVQKITDTIPPSLAQFSMFKVECSTDEDLCQDLKAFPEVRLFYAGKKVESRDMSTVDEIKEYLREVLLKYYPGLSDWVSVNLKTGDAAPLPLAPPAVVAPSSSEEKTPQPQDASKKIAILDDIAKRRTKPRSHINPKGEIVHIKTDDWETLISTSDNLPWFVMFGASWCGHCKALAPTWATLAAKLKGFVNVGKVECSTESLCRTLLVNGYPALKFFVNAQTIVDFVGNRALSNLEEFALGFTKEPAFTPILAEQLMDKIAMETNSFVILFDPSSMELVKLMNVVTELNSQRFFKLFVVPDIFSPSLNFLFTANSAIPSAQIPLLFAVKDHARVIESFGDINYDPKTKERLSQWIRVHRLPLVPELDTANHKELMNGDSLVVIMLIDPARHQAERGYVEQAARDWADFKNPSTQPVRFIWLDGTKWSKYIQRVYTISPEALPKLIISDPGIDKYYDDFGGPVTTSQAIVVALSDVLEGRNVGKGTSNPIKLSILVAKRYILQLISWIYGALFTLSSIPVILGVLVMWYILRARGVFRHWRGFYSFSSSSAPSSSTASLLPDMMSRGNPKAE